MIGKFAYLLVAIACGLSTISAQSSCRTCMASNGAYCIDDTSYYLCLDGRNPSNATFSKCPSGQVCTGSVNICEPESGSGGVSNSPVCSSSCGKCPASSAVYKLYTCVSRTQFGRCLQNAVAITGQCEDGQICSSDLYAKYGIICAPQCVADFHDVSTSCNSDEIVTTTTAAPPTVNPGSIKEQCRRASSNFPSARVFYIPNDNDIECKTYIFCERFGNDFEGLLVRCANGNFFNPPTQTCGSEKPSQCSLSTSATQTPTTVESTTLISSTTVSVEPTTLISSTTVSVEPTTVATTVGSG